MKNMITRGKKEWERIKSNPGIHYLYSKSRKKWLNKIKLKVFNHYCNGDIKCMCCGEKEIRFLTVDHINGNGHQHRKNIKHEKVFYWLWKNKLPRGFQILCYNCNCVQRTCKICPHKEKEIDGGIKNPPETNSIL